MLANYTYSDITLNLIIMLPRDHSDWDRVVILITSQNHTTTAAAQASYL